MKNNDDFDPVVHKRFHIAESIIQFIILVLLLISIFSGKVDAAQLSVKMLDVGQGDSFLIQSESENILIDTGDLSNRSLLLNQLNQSNVSIIHRLILTHPHTDHIANAAFLINHGMVAGVYDNGRAVANQHYRNYLKACKLNDVPVQTLREGDCFFLDDGAFLEILNSNNHSKNINNDSIVARLVYGDFSMIFTGDSELPVEDFLYQNVDVASNILKAAHHGSKTSNSLDFVTAVHPQFVFISAAKGNSFHHPHKASLENFILAGVPKKNIFCTAFNGSVTVSTDGNSFSVVPAVYFNWVDSYLGYKIQTVDVLH